MRRTAAVVLLVALAGCMDAEWGDFEALGERHSIRCFSGGVEIYRGTSTGRVISPPNSDGWRFVSVETGLLTEVSGECIIEVKED